MIRRREFITLVGGAAVWPLAARAQDRERLRRVGVLLPATADDAGYQARVGAFLQGLQQLGWRIGQNVQVDIRWATPDADVIRRHAAELAAQAPHVILAFGASTVGPMLQVLARCRSCSRLPPIRSAPALSRTWPGPRGMPPGLWHSNSASAESGSNCSSRLRRR